MKKQYKGLFLILAIIMVISVPVAAFSFTDFGKAIKVNDQTVGLQKIGTRTQIYDKNEFMDSASSMSNKLQSGEVSEQLTIYQDNNKNQYLFNQQGQLTSFTSKEFLDLTSPDYSGTVSMKKANTLSKNDISASVFQNSFLQSQIPDLQEFKLLSVERSPDPAFDGFTVELQKKMTNELWDHVSVRFDSAGNLQWAVIGRANLTEITAPQKEALVKELNSYLDSVKEYYSTCDYRVSYRKVNDKILANYFVTFYDKESNVVDREAISVSIDS